jgi:O-antigen/teichoic acid export membrane protein
MLASFRSISAFSLIAAIFPFFMLPFLADQLTQKDFGTLVLFDSFVTLATPVIHFSIAGVIVEYYKLNEQQLRSYIYNSILISLPVITTLLLFSFATRTIVESRYDVDGNVYVLLPVIVYANFFIQLYLILCACQNKTFNYALFTVVPPLLIMISTVSLIYFNLLSWQAKAYSMFFIYMFFAFLALYRLWNERLRLYIFEFNKKIIELNLKFTLPLLPHTCAASLYFVLDRFFIAEYVNNEGVAIYSAGLQLAMIMGVIQNAFSKAWNPLILSVIKNENDSFVISTTQQNTMLRLMMYALIGMTLMFFFLGVFIYMLVPYILPPEYIEARYVGLYLSTGFYFLGFYKTVSPVLWHFKKSKFISQITLTVLGVNVLLNYFLVPSFGIYGAAAATVLSMFLQFLFTALYVSKLWKKYNREIIDV